MCTATRTNPVLRLCQELRREAPQVLPSVNKWSSQSRTPLGHRQRISAYDLLRQGLCLVSCHTSHTRHATCYLKTLAVLGSDHGKSSRRHGQSDVPYIPLKLPTKPTNRVRSSCLHIILCLFNAIGDSVLRRIGMVTFQSDLYGLIDITKSLPTKMASFKEMNAENCLT